MKLKPLPIISLCKSYALILDNKRIKHYSVSHARSMLANSKPPLELILEQIQKEFGPDVKIEVVPEDSTEITQTFRELAEDSFDALLESKTLKNINKFKSNGLIHQYDERVWWSGRFPFTLLSPLIRNRFVYAADDVIRHFCVESIKKVGHEDWDLTYRSKAHDLLMSAYFGVRNFFMTLTEEIKLRRVAIARFLTVVCEESQVDQAITQLANDLNIVDKELKVLGHLTKFHIMTLVNTIGCDGKVVALMTFPIVEAKKYRMTGEKELRDLMKKKGVKGWSGEGEIIYLNDKAPYSQYVLSPEHFIGTGEVLYVDDSSPSESLDRLQEALEAGISAEVPQNLNKKD